MKMEIKHLAPYLPYELKYKIIGGGDRKYVMDGIYSFNDVYSDDNGECDIIMIKPILRPLSDLTKEIEHNGEKFLPMEKLREIYTERLCFDNNGFYYHIGESLVRGKAHDTHFPFNQLEAYSYLFEWHFDVFNLHENGLCIYYNELKH